MVSGRVSLGRLLWRLGGRRRWSKQAPNPSRRSAHGHHPLVCVDAEATSGSGDRPGPGMVGRLGVGLGGGRDWDHVRTPGVLELCGPVGFGWGPRIQGTVMRGPRIRRKPLELGIHGRIPALQDDLHVSVRASRVPGWGGSICSLLLNIREGGIQNKDAWKPTRVGVGCLIWVAHRVPSPCIRGAVSRP